MDLEKFVARADAAEAQAEEMLREALTVDLYHGPAHNNLGVLFLRQSKLYEAAAKDAGAEGSSASGQAADGEPPADDEIVDAEIVEDEQG